MASNKKQEKSMIDEPEICISGKSEDVTALIEFFTKRLKIKNNAYDCYGFDDDTMEVYCYVECLFADNEENNVVRDVKINQIAED